MQRTALFVSVGLLAAALALPANAQQKFEGGPQAGARSAEISGNVIYGARDDSSGQVTVQLGYYVSPHLEYGAAVGLRFENDPAVAVKLSDGGTGVQSSSSTTSGNVGGLIRYHFGQARTIPYVALYPNYTFAKLRGFHDDHLLLIPAVGADFFIKPQQSIVVELSVPTSVTNGSSSRAELNFGLKTFF